MINTLISAYKKKIEINSFYLSGVLYPLINNGHDNFIEDRSATPEEKSYVNPVRISTVKKPIKKTKADSTPYGYEDVFIMVSDNETIIVERLEFNYQNNRLKIIKRDPKIKYGTIFGYEYELSDITSEAVYGT